MSGITNLIGAVSGVTSSTSNAGGIESGTKQVFHQTAAPTGWTKLTATGTGSASIDNVCLRCITGTITNGVGGTVAMTTALASQSVASHTLATNELAAHTHVQATPCFPEIVNPIYTGYSCVSDCAMCSCATTSAGGGAGHTHTAIDLAVKYVDVIVASKD